MFLFPVLICHQNAMDRVSTQTKAKFWCITTEACANHLLINIEYTYSTKHSHIQQLVGPAYWNTKK